EPDITVAKEGACPGTTDSTIADLVDEDSSSPYRTGLCYDTHFEDWLDHVKTKALEKESKLALIAFDIKSSAADAVHVKKILDAIRTRLTFYVPNLNVLLSVGSLADAKTAFGDGTETSWAGITPPLRAKEGVMIDGEDDAQAVYDFFINAKRINQYSNFGYGDGTAVNALGVSFNGAQPRALDKGAFLRAKLGSPKVISYAYLLNSQAEMNSFINSGADGIIPGTITSVVPVPDTTCASYYQTVIDNLDKNSSSHLSDIGRYLELKLLCSLSNNPASDLDVSEIKNLVSVVSSHPEIKVATADDNPFLPKQQYYGLEIATPTGGGNGTDSNLQFTLTGCKGTAQITVNTGHILPIIYDSGRMENGNTDYVTIPSADLGTLESIKIYNDGTGLGPDWTFKDLKVSSAGYIGADVNSAMEYQALGTTTLPAFDSVTLPLKANFSGGGNFSAPSLPDLIAECSANLPSPAPTASQSCSATPITGTTTSTGPFGQGDTSITWTFTDSAKNTKTRTQAVHVHDTIAPVADVASLPAVIAQCSAVLPAAPTATDNCSGKITGTTTSPTTFGQGDFTATWTFTDAQSNHSAENQSVQVHDTIAPVIHCSAPIVVNAADPKGVTVPFSVTATDNCMVTSLVSVPASGSKFAIGTTTVNSQARDIALPTGNVSACSFTVHVKGVVEQLQDLLIAVTDQGPGKSLASKVQEALNAVQSGKTSEACSILSDFMSEVKAQSGKKLTNAQATSFLTDAARIRSVLGC
ncbi:MAG: HYR domain-containing protein, partial [Acidobacteriota bacterium]|nr:HYR domain-containing protein [Acidobacteriota bacterium]